MAAPYANNVKTGEIVVGTTAADLPNITCQMVCFKARAANADRIYLGSSSAGGGGTVTTPDGTTDATTGFELSAGETSPWMSLDNLNRLRAIAGAAAQGMTYIALI